MGGQTSKNGRDVRSLLCCQANNVDDGDEETGNRPWRRIETIWSTPTNSSTVVQHPCDDEVGEDHEECVEDIQMRKKGRQTFRKPKDAGDNDDEGQEEMTDGGMYTDISAHERLLELENETINIFNSVMLSDGLKVLEHYDQRCKATAASSVLKFAPDERGGALVWKHSVRKPTAKKSEISLAAVVRVEREGSIVWVTARDHRVGFETKRTGDALILSHALCILIDRIDR